MKNLSSKQMQQSIETILKALKLYDRFTSLSSFSVKIVNGSYMPLSIEKYGTQVTVTHYFKQNGDLVPDPDMEFQIACDGAWYPVAIQHSTGHYSRCTVEDENGNTQINTRERLDQKRFADMWARNLIAQGFEKGSIERQSVD